MRCASQDSRSQPWLQFFYVSITHFTIVISVNEYSPPTPQRLAVVDDHGIMRGVFLTLVEDTPEYTIAWMAASLAEARENIERDLPDLLLMDVGLPDGSGFDFVREVHRLVPDLPVLILSAQEDKSYPEQARDCGARGFIAKTTSLDLLVEAVSTIQAGGSWFNTSSTKLATDAMINEGGAIKQPSI